MAAFSSLLKPAANVFMESSGFKNNNKKMDLNVTCSGVNRVNKIEAFMNVNKDLNLISKKPDWDVINPIIRGEPIAVFDYKEMEKEEEKKVNADRLEHWIQQSVGEIVKNIGEAPFLMQIFSQGPSSLKLLKDEASPDSWPHIKKRWDQSKSTPDGIILVEELKDEKEEEEIEEEALNNDNGNNSSSSSKTWGLVVQGRGMECAASCYILKTCRVKSTAGFCTHFCLVRAKCFGESLDKQLRNAWLQGR